MKVMINADADQLNMALDAALRYVRHGHATEGRQRARQGAGFCVQKGPVFMVWGDEDHVRVRQSDGAP